MTKDNKPQIIVILGPNASGKSDLGVEIAKKIGGEIISADSRQVYKGMDIGSGKITKKEMKSIPHYLLDVVSPKKEFNVTHFKKLAEDKIKEIIKRGKIPMIVGGTGFWIDSLVYDYNLPAVGPDKKLRAKLDKLSNTELFKKLHKLDPVRAKNIDKDNKRRLVRALEIVLVSKAPVPVLKNNPAYKVLFIGIKRTKEDSEARIYKRLKTRLNEGMVEEIKKLHDSGVSWKRLDDFGLEYRYISRYLRKQLTYDEMTEELFKAIKKYWKRQLTWFKRNKKIHWVTSGAEAERLAKKFLYN
jgi:tRNA dimethylallyltransferase